LSVSSQQFFVRRFQPTRNAHMFTRHDLENPQRVCQKRRSAGIITLQLLHLQQNDARMRHHASWRIFPPTCTTPDRCGEMLGPMPSSIQTRYYYLNLMAEAAARTDAGRFASSGGSSRPTGVV
jgi:hypothetical protein